MRFRAHVLVVFCLFSLVQCRNIKTGVVSTWRETSLIAEASEFLGAQDANAMWSFAEHTSRESGKYPLSQLQQYTHISGYGKEELSSHDYNSLLYALSLRYFSPKVEMHNQLARKHIIETPELGSKPCFAVATGGAQPFQTKAALQAHVEKSCQGEEIELFEFDHMYPRRGLRPTCTVILYCDTTSSEFTTFHAYLKESHTNYALRHHQPNHFGPHDEETAPTGGPAENASAEWDRYMYVQGYGVQLQIKNMEYKNVDDKKAEVDSTQGGETEEPEELDAGFNFDILQQRKPHLREALLEFKDLLQQENDALRTGEDTDEIKVWQLQALGLQACSRVIRSAQPLDTLADIAQNFPRRAGAISKVSTSDKKFTQMKDAISLNQATLFEAQEGGTVLHINSRAHDIATLTPFALYDVIKGEGAVMSGLIDTLWKWGTTSVQSTVGQLAQDMLSTSMGAKKSQGNQMQMGGGGGGGSDAESLPRFRFRNNIVSWLNDIEKDPMYSMWPKELNELLQPSFYGQVRYSRRNLYTVMYLIDPTDREQLWTATLLVKFMQQQAPTKMGLVLVCADTVAAVQKMRLTDDTDLSNANTEVEDDIFGGDQVIFDTDGSAETVTEENDYKHQDTLANRITAVFHHIDIKQGADAAFMFLSRLHQSVRGEKVSENDLKTAFAYYGGGGDYDEIVAAESAKDFIKKTALYIVDRGMTTTPICLFNGVLARGKSPREPFFEGIQREQQYVRELIADGVLVDKQKDMLKAILDHTNAGTRYSPQVFDGHQFVVLPVKMQARLGASVEFLYPKDYPQTKAADITQLLLANPNSKMGSTLIVQVLNQLTSDNMEGHSSTRVGFVFVGTEDPNTEATASAFMSLQISCGSKGTAAQTLLQFAVIVQKAVHKGWSTTAGTKWKEFLGLTVKKLGGLIATKGANDDEDDSSPYSKKKNNLVIDFDVDEFDKIFHQGHGTENMHKAFEVFSDFAKYLSMSGDDSIIWVNGRKLVVSQPGQILAEDIGLLQIHEYQQRVKNLNVVLDKYKFSEGVATSASRRNEVSIAIAGLTSVLAHDWFKNGERSTTVPPKIIDSHPGAVGVHPLPAHSVEGQPPMIDIVVILNPLSYEAQKLSTFLQSIHSAFSSHISIYFNPHHQTSELPLKSFYRYVLRPDLKFDQQSGTIVPPTAYFTNLPTTQVLTMGIDEPESWIVQSRYAVYDLDNIKLEQLGEKRTLYAEYQLEHIVVTGSCVDVSQGQPPRGLELVMNNEVNPRDTTDTLVMSNYGYFQLKGTPGVWRLTLKPKSRGEKIFDIADQVSIDITSTSLSVDYERKQIANAVLQSFAGEYIYLKVKRKEGMEDVELLAENDDMENPLNQVWETLGSFMGNKKEEEKKGDGRPVTLNIFSVASGHLYERLLRIMIDRVLETANATENAKVRFWFLKNFLSPGMKRLLPHYAEKWGFEYELVTYKWPNWLTKQTEKQRIIWAYKILFLDVLFPLSLDKVIFVDADQIVKADLHELYNMDLKGAPLAYTPFCDSRKETEGFRFWKQGFWQDHLRGKPYHISAIYVVDIKKLRQMAAGDNLRMIYDNLSQDPNSLANLDQDLPNYTQHLVPIHSLPLEWLWCETWCEDESKARAKTIDLCNNPLTKVPKLDAARRIVPEWNDYDEKVQGFIDGLSLPKW